MPFAFLLRCGRVLLVLELCAFIYWVVVIGVVGAAHPQTFLGSIVSALHYTATFAVYQGIAEIVKAYEESSSGRRDVVQVQLGNMWIALAAVALVTDCTGLALAMRHNTALPEADKLDATSHNMIVALAALFVALTVVDALWLLALRILVGVQSNFAHTRSISLLTSDSPTPAHQPHVDIRL
jgi:hypothetical protein